MTSIGNKLKITSGYATGETGWGGTMNTNLENIEAAADFSVMAYGAVGDGVTDDAAAIQLALTAATSAGGGTVRLPAKEFAVSVPLRVTAGVNLIGVGKMGTGTSGTKIIGTAANQDVVRLQGNCSTIAGILIEGADTSGTGCGIRHTGLNENGAPILVNDINITDCWISGTPSWGIELAADASYELFSNFITNTCVVSSVGAGSLLYGVGSSSPSLICRGCTFDGGIGTLTYGAGTMTKGAVHIETSTNVTFEQCIFEPTNSTAISMLTTNAVVIRDSKFTMFTGGGTGRYFITTSGFNSTLVVDGCQFARTATTHGPRILKTDANGGAGGSTNLVISNCKVDTSEASGSTDDIYLGSGDDQLTVFNVHVLDSGGTTRNLVDYNNVASVDRRRIPSNSLALPFGSYNKGHLLLGGRHIYNDANLMLRSRWFNDSTSTPAPSSATDGDLVAVDNAYVTLEDTTTPSVATLNGGRNFKCSPAGGTTITTFDDATNGQTIRIIFTNGNATLNDGGSLKLNTALGNFTSSADDVMVLTYDGTSWYEVSRSVN